MKKNLRYQIINDTSGSVSSAKSTKALSMTNSKKKVETIPIHEVVGESKDVVISTILVKLNELIIAFNSLPKSK